MYKLVSVLLVTFLCYSCVTTEVIKSDSEHKAVAWRAVAFGAAGLDLATTLAGKQSGAREQNPALGQQPQRIALASAAILGLVWWLSRDMAPEQQVKIWRWLAAIHICAAGWNYGQLKR